MTTWTRTGSASCSRRPGSARTRPLSSTAATTIGLRPCAYWLLKYRGFENVKLLDGGRKKWQIESLPLESDLPS